MFRNYLRVAVRTLLRNKSYLIINTFGLGIALSCCITAYLLLAYNIEFDNFHDDDKVANVFKVHVYAQESDGKISQSMMAPMPLGPSAADEIAGIERYTRYIRGYGSMNYGDKAFYERPAFADSTFFEMFHFPLVYGSHEAFKNKHSIFLTEGLAKKYFANEDPTGKQMTLDFKNDVRVEVIVGGVIQELPVNNSFTFECLLRVEVFNDYNNLGIDSWGDWRTPDTFVALTSLENAEDISIQLNQYVTVMNELLTNNRIKSFRLEHFKAPFTNDHIEGRSYTNLRYGVAPLMIFNSMALTILLIACFNLTNTSIAMSGKRLKEVGVRKVVGAARRQIFFQFLTETVITIILSLCAGMMMAQIIVPAFASMWGFSYGLEDLGTMNLFIAMLLMLFLASLLTGVYPALFNSRFKPVALLKGSVKIRGTNALTRSLVALQFALSIIVLVAGVVFIQNTKFQESVQFGYDKDNIIIVSVQGPREFSIFENVISSNPKILSVSVSDGNLGSGGGSWTARVQVDTKFYDVRATGIGKNYIETMGLDVIQGRTLDANSTSDRDEGIVVNSEFLKQTQIKDPVGHVVIYGEVRRRIVGVVDNHVDNLFRSAGPEPFLFYLAPPAECRDAQIRTLPGEIDETRAYLEKTWKETFPDKPFRSYLQDDLVLGGVRQTNASLKKVSLFITFLGGLLSASGIFSLASLNIARRTKEIGVRKVMGASVNNIVALFNREFIILLLAAGVLGSVGGYLLTNKLLNELFAYRVPVTLLTVVLCALSIFAVGILTTSTTILKAAQSNPVDTLRNE